MRNHRLAAYDADEYEGWRSKPQGLKAKYCPDYLSQGRYQGLG